MAKYKIRGKIYTADSEQEARAMAFRDTETSQPVDWSGTAKGNAREVGNLVKGFTSQAENLGRSAVNLALPKSMEPEWATDESIKKFRQENQPVNAGSWGAFGADMALLGGPTAALEKGLTKAGLTLLPRAGKALQVAGRVARGATSGASQGVLLASPDERGAGAAIGGALGGAISSIGEGGKFISDTFRKARISDKAKVLLQSLREADDSTVIQAREILAKLRARTPLTAAEEAVRAGRSAKQLDKYVKENEAFIPAAQGLEDGMLKQFYTGFVSNVPHAGGKVRRQFSDAVENSRVKAIQNALPEDATLEQIFQPGDDFQRGLERLDEKWKEKFLPVNQHEFDVPPDFYSDKMRQLFKERFDITLPEGGRFPGEALTLTRTRLADAMADPKLVPEGRLGDALRGRFTRELEKIDQLMEGQMPTDMAQTWKSNLEKYKGFQDLIATVKSYAPGNAKFPMQGLADTASRRAGGNEGVFGKGGSQQDLGNLSAEVLKDFPSKQGIFQTLAAMGAGAGVTSTAGAALGSPPLLLAGAALAAPQGIGELFASKAVQRRLLEGSNPVSPATKALMRWGRRSTPPGLFELTRDEEEENY